MLKIKLFKLLERLISFDEYEVYRKNQCRECLGFHRETTVDEYDYEASNKGMMIHLLS